MIQHVQSSIDRPITYAASLHASYCDQQYLLSGTATIDQLLTTRLPRPLPADFIPTYLPSLIAHWLSENASHTLPAVQLQLLYRASRDGFGARDFHGKCDNKGATVTVITSREGYVFGGYADQSWTSPPNFTSVASSSAFLFSLVCASCDVATKLPLTGQNNQCAMRCYSIADSANTNTNSYTNLGRSYTLPPGMGGTTYFTGSHYFQASEVEVYQVTIM